MRVNKKSKKAPKSIMDTSENEGTLMKQLAQTVGLPFPPSSLI
jgi:hypothetical protein